MSLSTFLWIAAVPTLLLVQIYFLGRKMSKPEQMFRVLPGGLAPQQEKALAPYRVFLASKGLVFRLCFKFGALQCVVFRHGELPRFFVFCFPPNKPLIFSAESYLTDSAVLDTSTSRSQGLFPRPGAYAQSFPNASIEDVWQRHLEAETFLGERYGLRLVPAENSYEELVLPAMRLRMTFARSQALWPVRVLYRWAVTRHTRVNRTVAQQCPEVAQLP